MIIDDHQRTKYLPRARIISGVFIVPFPLIAILIIPIFGGGKIFYYAISIPAVLMAGVTSKTILDRLIDRDQTTIFGRIVIWMNDKIWKSDI